MITAHPPWALILPACHTELIIAGGFPINPSGWSERSPFLSRQKKDARATGTRPRTFKSTDRYCSVHRAANAAQQVGNGSQRVAARCSTGSARHAAQKSGDRRQRVAAAGRAAQRAGDRGQGVGATSAAQQACQRRQRVRAAGAAAHPTEQTAQRVAAGGTASGGDAADCRDRGTKRSDYRAQVRDHWHARPGDGVSGAGDATANGP
ncbi:hypothetical protein DL763_009398 [Monosporascus cannonballus]|nr:hypothetical protein DL763_009398 [Monosporascus cannonballus]